MREWRNVGGLAVGGLVYEHRGGAVAYLHAVDGDLRIAAWDPASGDELAFPAREALEAIAAQDLWALREESETRIRQLLIAGHGHDDEPVVAARNNLALLELTGIRYATVRSHRGSKLVWTPERLAAFARGFVHVGDRWTSEHEAWARQRWGLKRRAVRAVMARAAHAGIVHIDKSGSANVYELTGTEVEPDDPRARANWHRRSWQYMNARRDELARATVGPPRPMGRQLSESPEILHQLAADGEARCEGILRGRGCALRAGHSGRCFVWLHERVEAA